MNKRNFEKFTKNKKDISFLSTKSKRCYVSTNFLGFTGLSTKMKKKYPQKTLNPVSRYQKSFVAVQNARYLPEGFTTNTFSV